MRQTTTCQSPGGRLPVLPADLAGAAVAELGCGSGYVSAWLARRGARPVGVDISARQLTVARRMQEEFGLRFPLIQGDAERVPLSDGCADLVISEYGAPVWCDPYRWIPEAARLLRPGGRLVFMGQSTLARMCTPDQGPVRQLARQGSLDRSLPLAIHRPGRSGPAASPNPQHGHVRAIRCRPRAAFYAAGADPGLARERGAVVPAGGIRAWSAWRRAS